MGDRRRGQQLGKAAIARATRIEEGDISTTDPRVSPMAQSLGIVFDGNNNVVSNQTDARLDLLEADTHTHSNKSILDQLTQADLDNIDLLVSKMSSIATLFGITFDGSGTITSENYSTHTHDYEDGTINDTADGTGVQTDTTRTTEGVN